MISGSHLVLGKNDGTEVQAQDGTDLNEATIGKTIFVTGRTASVVYWSEFLATDPDVSVSIPGAT
jgi:hypothetical protein